ncbi:hypothetical protein SELMODRAFT_425464 [Selaginella moellendorffii]|uniref:DUF7148 domain-containing protein n=1 Tax=Selaginella moellendorffii TaxID=88036 RepID=D8ST66_SELML|nr:uncharacterized protein LOC9659335 [Selaginella moellendorffii]EFJ12351.1 hypothetical protein SELMODRAFT_425464 [Selaginella moellendorffii]|eukprot:XP_002986494.1 uncharacterized protein LOC9659335 [Selaginella moellendorffii]
MARCPSHVSSALSLNPHSSSGTTGCGSGIFPPRRSLPAFSSNTGSISIKQASKSTKCRELAVSGAGSSIVQEDEGEPISLGTAKLPANVDVKLLEDLMFQWGNSLMQNANFTLELPLKVDKVKNGVRLAYIRINEGVVEDLVYIDVLVLPPSSESTQPFFLAQRSGKLKNSVPPGEPAIMQSLLQALKKSVQIATPN